MEKIHPGLKSISWLIGSWLGKNGNLHYPTIKTQNYFEKLEVTHPAINQPVLHLNFVSWFQSENGEKTFKHMESGYLKAKPQSEPAFFIYTSSHNNGIVLIEEGSLVGNELTLNSVGVTRCSISKPPHVVNTRRVISFVNTDNISLRMHMSTSNHSEIEEHLSIDYHRVE